MIELDPGLDSGSLLELATVTLGLVLVFCAVGARVASPLTRRWLAFALAGVLVVASSPLVGRMDERHDVDGLQAALRRGARRPARRGGPGPVDRQAARRVPLEGDGGPGVVAADGRARRHPHAVPRRAVT